MRTKMIFQRLRYLKLISIILLGCYSMHPFINGVGCDFHSQMENEELDMYTVCQFGIVSTVAKNKKTGAATHYVGLYGKSGDTIFFGVISQNVIRSGEYSLKAIKNFFNNGTFFVARNITYNDKDWILMQYPYYDVYSTTRVGSLGFM